MTERSLYPNRVEVQQQDLTYTESTKSAQLRQRTIDIINGRVAGLEVTVNLSISTLVDVSAGRAYVPDGEQSILAVTETGLALSDYTNGTDNFVTLVYTEVETEPSPTEVGSTTRNTRTVQVATLNVYTAAEFNALPATLPDDLSQIAQDRAFIIATVNANGTGVPLTANDITQPVQGGSVVVGSLTATGTDQVTLTNAIAPLVVGPAAGAHLEVGANGLQWKINETLGGTMVLNPVGGNVQVSGNLVVVEDVTASGRISTNSNTAVTLIDELSPLRVGPAASAHLEVGNNGAQWKSNSTTADTFPLQPLGGDLTVGTTTSQLFIPSTEDADLIGSNAALIVGPAAASHIEISRFQVQAKATDLVAASIFINPLGGEVILGSSASSFTRSESTTVELFSRQGEVLSARNLLDGNPLLGTAQNVYMQFERADGTPLMQLGLEGAIACTYRNLNNGGGVFLQANNASGILTTLLEGDPDSDTAMYHAGTSSLRTKAVDTDATSGSEVLHRSGTFYDVGLGITPIVQVSTNRVISPIDCGVTLLVVVSTVEITFNVDANIPVGAFGYILNSSLGTIDLNEGVGVLLDRYDTDPVSGSFDLLRRGWAKWFKVDGVTYNVIGVGFDPAPAPPPW